MTGSDPGPDRAAMVWTPGAPRAGSEGPAWLLDHRSLPDDPPAARPVDRGSALGGTLWRRTSSALGSIAAAASRRRPGSTAFVADALGRVQAATVWRDIDPDPPTSSDLPDVGPRTLFVYGTLRQGQSRAGALNDPAPSAVVPARVPGLLWETPDDYPVWTPPAPSEAAPTDPPWVHGELVTWAVPPPWERLDAVEEFNGHGRDDNLFVRTLVLATDAAGTLHLTWAYAAGPRVQRTRQIVSGDWCRRAPPPHA